MWEELLQPFLLTEDEAFLVFEVKLRGKLIEMFRGFLPAPARVFHDTLNEILLAGEEIDHSAIVMPYESDIADSQHGDGVGHLELHIADIGPGGTDDESKVLRDTELFAGIHTHGYE